MRKTDIPITIQAFKQQFGPIQPLNPRLIGFSWAIGIQGDNVVLAKKYSKGIYEFRLMTMENYERFKKTEENR